MDLNAVKYIPITQRDWAVTNYLVNNLGYTLVHGVETIDNSTVALASIGREYHAVKLLVNSKNEVDGKLDHIQLKSQTHQMIEVSTNGNQLRWVSIAATSVLNRAGEIDSRQLFALFEHHARKTGYFPFLTYAHQGRQFKFGQADNIRQYHNSLIVEGYFDYGNSESAKLAQIFYNAIRENPSNWEISIGYLLTKDPEITEIGRGFYVPVYREGIMYELSLLPAGKAANQLTKIFVS